MNKDINRQSYYFFGKRIIHIVIWAANIFDASRYAAIRRAFWRFRNDKVFNSNVASCCKKKTLNWSELLLNPCSP